MSSDMESDTAVDCNTVTTPGGEINSDTVLTCHVETSSDAEMQSIVGSYRGLGLVIFYDYFTLLGSCRGEWISLSLLTIY